MLAFVLVGSLDILVRVTSSLVIRPSAYQYDSETKQQSLVWLVPGEHPPHTPSIAFRHLPPNSARFSYATEGALFVSVQLSTDVVSAL